MARQTYFKLRAAVIILFQRKAISWKYEPVDWSDIAGEVEAFCKEPDPKARMERAKIFSAKMYKLQAQQISAEDRLIEKQNNKSKINQNKNKPKH